MSTTPQREARYATSLLFTPRSDGGGSAYRPQRGGGGGGSGTASAKRSPSPTPEAAQHHREGSFFREGSVGFGSTGGRLFSREGSAYRDGSAQPETPAPGGRRGGPFTGERSRLGQPLEAHATPHRGFSPALATSRGRRRSSTPVGSAPPEAPPPPPTDSLFDSSAVGAAWATPTPAEPANMPDDEDRQEEAQAPTAENTDQWVIVYGFKAGDVELVMREFGKCGDILQHGTFGQPGGCNWLYLQFQDRWAAQRALVKDGELLSRTLMIAVRPLDAVHRAHLREHLHADTKVQAPAAPKPALARRYMIDAPAPQANGSSGVPPPSQSTWAKVSEFVFGL